MAKLSSSLHIGVSKTKCLWICWRPLALLLQINHTVGWTWVSKVNQDDKATLISHKPMLELCQPWVWSAFLPELRLLHQVPRQLRSFEGLRHILMANLEKERLSPSVLNGWALVKRVSISDGVLVISPYGRNTLGCSQSPFHMHISLLPSLWQQWQENIRDTQSNNNSFLNSGDIWLTCFHVNNVRIAMQLANNDGII